MSNLLERVEYVDNPDLLNPSIFNILKGGLNIEAASLGKYKNTYWEFQKEKRYILRFLPISEKDLRDSNNRAQTVYDAFFKATEFLSYYDLSIRDDAFQQMEITLAPQFTTGNQVLLDALKEKYNPNMHISESKLQGKVKL